MSHQNLLAQNIDYYVATGYATSEFVQVSFDVTFTVTTVATCVQAGYGCDNAVAVTITQDDTVVQNVVTTIDIDNYYLRCSNPVFDGIWFTFTNTFTSKMTINTFGSAIDTGLVVLGGSCPRLACVGSNDDFDTFTTSEVEFCAEANLDYFVIAGGWNDDVIGTIVVSFISETAPECIAPGTSCLTAIDVPVVIGETVVSGTTSTGTGNFVTDCEIASFDGVWYSFNNDFDSELTISSAGSNFDTTLIVLYGDSCDDLSCFASNDDADGITSMLTLCAAAGTDYYVFIGGIADNAVGSYSLSFSATETEGCITSGISCADPLSLSLLSDGLTVTGVTYSYLTDATDICEDEAFDGAWFTISNPFFSSITASSEGSDFDTVLLVLSGSCDDLSCVISNDDADDDASALTSKVTFCAPPNVVFYLFLGGYARNEIGNYQLSVTYSVVEDCIPAGLSCETAVEVFVPEGGSTPAVYRGTNIVITSGFAPVNAFATNTLTACSDTIYNGIWFAFSNDFESVVTASTAGSNFDTILAVLTGSCSMGVYCVDYSDDIDEIILTSQITFCSLSSQ